MAKTLEELRKFNKKRNNEYTVNFGSIAYNEPITESYIKRLAKIDESKPVGTNQQALPVRGSAARDLTSEQRQKLQGLLALGGINTDKRGASAVKSVTDNFMEQFKTDTSPDNYMPSADPTSTRKYYRASMTDAQRGTNYAGGIEAQSRADIAQGITDKKQQNLTVLRDAYASALTLQDPVLIDKAYKELKAAEAAYKEAESISKPAVEEVKTISKENKAAEFTYNYVTSAQGNADYDTVSEKGKTADSGRAYTGYNMDTVQNKVRYYENNRQQIIDDLNMNGAINIYERWDYLTEEEKKAYDYMIGSGQFEKAEDFLSGMDRTLQYRQEQQIAKDIEKEEGINKHISAFAYGTASGFGDAIGNIMTPVDRLTGKDVTENVNTTAMQEVFAQSEEKGLRFMNSMGQTLGNMIPSLALGGPLGQGVMFMNSAGSAYREAKGTDASELQCVTYALLSGASEVFLQNVLGGIDRLGSKGNVGKVVSEAIKKVAGKVQNQKLLAALIGAGDFVGDAAGESLEEYLQTIITPVLQNLFLGADNQITLTSPEQLEAALSGALFSTVFNGISLAGGANASVKESREMQGANIRRELGGVESVIGSSMAFDENSMAYKNAQKLAKKAAKKGIDKITDTDLYWQGAYINDAINNLKKSSTVQNTVELTEQDINYGKNLISLSANSSVENPVQANVNLSLFGKMSNGPITVTTQSGDIKITPQSINGVLNNNSSVEDIAVIRKIDEVAKSANLNPTTGEYEVNIKNGNIVKTLSFTVDNTGTMTNLSIDDEIDKLISNSKYQRENSVSVRAEELPPVEQNNATVPQENSGGTNVGRVTKINSPYSGPVPEVVSSNNNIVEISNEAVHEAQNKIDESKNSQDRSLRSALTKAIEAIFFPENSNPIKVKVSNVKFDNNDYVVTFNKSAISKIVSDLNISAEKIAILYGIEDVIENGKYVGSGKYIQHGKKVKDTIRFDYFESDVTINGTPYIVTFDVEVFPSTNNYRTHKINKIDLIAKSGTDTGPVPAAHGNASSLNMNISQTTQNINTPAENSTENISTNVVPTFETQQYVSVPAPIDVEQQTQPVPSAQQEASATTEAAHAVTPFTARNFTNAEARKGYIDGFAEKLAETIGISKRDLLNRYGNAINELADDMEISSEIPEKNIEKLVSPLVESANFVRKKTRDSAVKRIKEDSATLYRQMQNYARATKNENARQLAMSAAGDLSVEEIDNLYSRQNELERVRNSVERKNKLTSDGKAILKDVLAGRRSIESIEGLGDAPEIKANYEAEVKLREVTQKIQDYNRSRKARKYLVAAALTKDAGKWADKKMGWQYSTETLERNFEDIVGDKELARKLINEYITPIKTANAEIVRRKNTIQSKIEKLNINQKAIYKFENFYQYLVDFYTAKDKNNNADVIRKQVADYYGVKDLSELGSRMVSEAELVQLYGEGIVNDAVLEKLGVSPEYIKKCVAEFKGIYEQLYAEVNRAYISNGYKPMGHIENYFPHYRKVTAKNWFKKFMRETVGVDGDFTAEFGTLPTDIAGLTDTFKPGRKFNEHALRRNTDITSFDCLAGMQSYLDTALQIIYQTDNIQNLRALEGQLRYMYSDDGVKARIAEVNNDLNLTEEERQKALEGIYMESNSQLGNFVQELRRYTNRLAGKKSDDDRPFEYLLSRPMYKVMNKLTGNVAGNMIGGNFGTALTNLAPLTLATGEVRTDYLLRGINDTAKRTAKEDGLMHRSNFYTARKGAETFTKTQAERISGALSKPMEFTDLFTVEAVFRGRYYQNMAQGMTDAEAIANADEYCSRLFADRNKNVMPTMFHATNPFMKLVTMFQLEVNNQLRYVSKDIVRSAGENKGVLVWQLIKILVSSWLANKAKEKLTGYGGLFDPVGVIEDAIYDFADDDISTGQALGNLINNVADQIPFISAFTGGGRIPVLNVVPTLEELPDTVDSIKAVMTGNGNGRQIQDVITNVILPAAYMLNPYGGAGQIKKTWQGIAAVAQGGEYGYKANGEEYYKYVVDNDTPGSTFWNYVQAGVFGKSALSEAQDYYDGNTGKLSPEQTAALQRLKEIGAGTYKVSQVMQTVNNTDASRDANGNIIDSRAENVINYVKDTDLKESEKEEVIYSSGVLSDEVIEDLHSAEEYDIPAMTFYNVYLAKLNAESDKDVNGKTVANSKSIYIREAIDDVSGLTDEQRMYLYELMGVNKTVSNASDFDLQMIYAQMQRQKDEAERRKSVGLLN